MNRYKVFVVNMNLRPAFRVPKEEIIWAYDPKDAFNQVDCLIDRTIQCERNTITMVKPYPLTLKERLKIIFK